MRFQHKMITKLVAKLCIRQQGRGDDKARSFAVDVACSLFQAFPKDETKAKFPSLGGRGRLLSLTVMNFLKLAGSLLGLIYLLSPTLVSAQVPTFDEKHNFGTGSDSTFSVAVGDMDGDGDLDIITGNSSQQNVVYLNDGAGNFGSSRNFGTGSDGGGIAVGDIDGDGHLDIVTSGVVYLNDGEGNFGSSRNFGTEGHSTSSVAVGDMDSDGDLDIITGNFYQQNVVYLNDGAGNFGSSHNFGTESDWTSDVAIGDVDGDGHLDIVTGNSDQNVIYLNNGEGNFGSSRNFGLTYNSVTNSVAVGDLNNDGHLDIITGDAYNPYVIDEFGDNVVYLNDGTGNFNTGHYFGDLGDNTESLTIGDVDGDGHLDIITGIGDDSANGINGQNVVYLNDGEGNFDIARNFGTGSDSTFSVAVGDVDDDGDLDIITGNEGQQNVIYLNHGQGNFGTSRYLGGLNDNTTSLAVGDVDSDGDLDIITGIKYGEPIDAANYVVYLNNGVGNFSSSYNFGIWSYDTWSLAVGDVDDDGHLDIVTGNSGDNVIYLNDGVGNFGIHHNFGTGSDQTISVAVGDVDSDGDLDIITGNSGDPNTVYLNDGVGNFTPHHNFGTEDDWTRDLVIGDVDGDAHLDIITGNSGQQNVVYLNDGNGNFGTARNFGTGTDRTTSVAIGDVDDDGDLDIITGNISQQNVVYLNDGNGNFGIGHNFGTSSDQTISVAVGDINGDGHLDIVTGNYSYERNKVYLNDGNGNFGTARNFGFDYFVDTGNVALGDVDGDGRLDIITGNEGQQNVIYLNTFRSTLGLLNTLPRITIPRPISTGLANFFSTPVILNQPTISFTYTLFDDESDPVRFIQAYYSPNGGGQWLPATLTPETQTTYLPTLPSGITHTLTWQADADLIKNDNVAFRIEAYEGFASHPGPFQYSYVSAHTFPFRVEAAEWYLKVINGTAPVEGAAIYQAGQLITESVGGSNLTNPAGLARLENPTAGQAIVAIKPTKMQTTTRATHNGWAYRTYLTSLNLDGEGTPQSDVIGEESGPQLITIRANDSLTLFNIVVSIEWDATEEYITMIEDSFHKASNYLYDVTDGQMAFEQVTIYDNAENWSDADFQFSTKNTVRPYAFVGGITSDDKAHTIRVGRFWSRQGGNRGAWNEPDGYRTLIHEFAHYALHLQDEYIARSVDDDGNLKADGNAACTDPLIKKSTSGDATNASIMYWPYNTSELVGADDWNENCRETLQHFVNGKSDWETVVEHYGGTGWIINTPTSRGGVMAGPDRFPNDLLPFPEFTVNNSGQTEGEALQVKIIDPAGEPVHNALVALYTSEETARIAIDQGLSDVSGRIDVYGAEVGDTIKVATFDGALSRSVEVVEGQDGYDIQLVPTGAKRKGLAGGLTTPYLNLIPGAKGDSMFLEVHGTNDGGNLIGVLAPGEEAGSPPPAPLAYSPTENAYTKQFNFDGVALGTGQAQVSGVVGSQIVQLNSDYNLLQVQKIQTATLYSEDGNFEFHLPVNSIEVDEAFATVLPTGYVPSPLPEGLSVIGNAYEVRLSGAETELEKDGVVRLHYHPEVMGVYSNTAIFHWDAFNQTWDRQSSEPNDTDNAWAVTARRLGIYALLGVDVTPPAGTIYLPVVIKE